LNYGDTMRYLNGSPTVEISLYVSSPQSIQNKKQKVDQRACTEQLEKKLKKKLRAALHTLRCHEGRVYSSITSMTRQQLYARLEIMRSRIQQH
jgi:hypothetical protein